MALLTQMYHEYIDQFNEVIFDAIAPAWLGLFVAWILGLKVGLYRDNQHKRKLTFEISFITVAAFLLARGLPAEYVGHISVLALFFGFGCTVIIQSIRIAITRAAEAYLDELFERRK